ncbi:Alphacatulinlike, partial [Caligus rogercresseyi]
MGYDEEDLLLRGGFREMDGLLDPPPQSTRVRSRYGSRSMGGMRLRSNSSGPQEVSGANPPKSTSSSGPPPGGGGGGGKAPGQQESGNTSGSNQASAPVSSKANQGKPPPILRSSSSNLNDNLGPALTRLGRSIGLSVEIFAAVGETIADENPEIRGDMLEACRESRAVGNSLEKLCEGLCLCVNNTRKGSSSSSASSTSMLPGNLSGGGLLHSLSPSDFETLIRSARVLLSGVTRILLLADNVVVNKLLISNDGDDPPKAVAQSSSSAGAGSGASLLCDQLSSLKTMHHFTEFVKAFCDYGSEM